MNTALKQNEIEHAFVYGDEQDIILAIQENKNIINCPFGSGFTPLEFACKFLSEKEVEMVLKEGGDILGQFGFSNLISLTMKSACHVDEKLRVLQTERAITGDYSPLQLAIVRRETALITSIVGNAHSEELNAIKTSNDETLMHLLVKSDFMTEAVFSILKEKCKSQINYHDRNGQTPFHYAIIMRESKIVQTLLDHGADVSVETYQAETCLHLVMKSYTEEDEKLHILIAPCKQQLDYLDEEGKTCLHWAVINQSCEMVKSLIQYGADTTLRTKDLESILHLTMRTTTDMESKCKVLIEEANCSTQINQRNVQGSTSLHLACRYGTAWIVDFLLQNGADPYIVDNNNRNALYYTICTSSGDTQAKLEIFIEREKNGDENSNQSILSSLLEMDVDGMSQTLKRLQTSDFDCPVGIQKLVKYIWKDDIPVNQPSFTLVLAVNHLSTDLCRYLIDAGADASSSYDDGESALHKAIKIGSIEKCKMLISRQAAVLKQWRGLNPLDCTVLYCKTDIIHDLLSVFQLQTDMEIDTRKCRFQGESDLTFATRLGCLELVQELLDEDLWALWQFDGTGMNAFQLAYQHPNIRKFIQTLVPSSWKYMNYEMKYWYDRIDGCKTMSTHKKDFGTVNTFSYKEYAIRVLAMSQLSSDNKLYSATKRICDNILEFFEILSEVISENENYAHLAFEPHLSGSMVENTKTFVPNECDIVCEILETTQFEIEDDTKSYSRIFVNDDVSNRWSGVCCGKVLNTVLFSKEFINAMDYAIESEWNKDNRPIYSTRYSLEIRDKIPCLHILYRESPEDTEQENEYIQDLEISIDFVPAIRHPGYTMEMKLPPVPIDNLRFYLIPKVSRRKTADVHSSFLVCYTDVESKLIIGLPHNIKQGYIYAKAMRYKQLCCLPTDEKLRLNEPIMVDEYITTYMLKTCLFEVLSNEDLFHRLENAHPILTATRLYGHLQNRIERHLSFYFDPQIKLFQCSHALELPYEDKLGCCLKRDVILCLCNNIKQKLLTLLEMPDSKNTTTAKQTYV